MTRARAALAISAVVFGTIAGTVAPALAATALANTGANTAVPPIPLCTGAVLSVPLLPLSLVVAVGDSDPDAYDSCQAGVSLVLTWTVPPHHRVRQCPPRVYPTQPLPPPASTPPPVISAPPPPPPKPSVSPPPRHTKPPVAVTPPAATVRAIPAAMPVFRAPRPHPKPRPIATPKPAPPAKPRAAAQPPPVQFKPRRPVLPVGVLVTVVLTPCVATVAARLGRLLSGHR